MSEGMWKLELDNETNRIPRDIVQEQCSLLSKATRDLVIARMAEYDGDYRSYTTAGGFMAVTENIANMSINKFDVQSKLGEETAESKFVYELYLTSQSMPKYKYRICFIYYGVLLYPVGISLEKEIANELGVPNAEFTVDTQDDFEEYLRRILGSKKVTLLIQNLYRIGRGETKYPRVIERRE